MRKAIDKYALNVGAIIGLALIAAIVGGFILANQRFHLPKAFPFLGSDYINYKVEVPTAQSLTPGQGQTVDVAGVPVGEISKVDLVDGQAVVTMKIRKKDTPIYRDATAVIRPKTGLNDEVIELSPGSRRSGVLKTDQVIPVNQSLSAVNLDEILAGLDGDTRSYLQLLIGGAGQALRGNGKQLSATFKRFEPTSSAVEQITSKLTDRRQNIARTVHNFRLLSQALAGKDKQLGQLVDASAAVFGSFAKQDQRLRESIRELPPTLASANTNLVKVNRFAKTIGPALNDLRPTARKLGPAQRQVRPFLRKTEPVIRTQLRPFSRDALPTVKLLRPAASDLARLTPDLTRTFSVVNYLFNELAYDKPNDGNDSYLFWTAWANHAGNAIFGTGDAHGPIRKGLVQVSCSSLITLDQIKQANPTLGTLVSLLNAPRSSDVCPKTAQAGSGLPGTGTTRSDIASADAPLPQITSTPAAGK